MVCSSYLLWSSQNCLTMLCCVLIANLYQYLLYRALLSHYQSHTLCSREIHPNILTWCKVVIITTMTACTPLENLNTSYCDFLAHSSPRLIIFVNFISARRNTCFSSTMSENVKIASGTADAARRVRTGSCHSCGTSHWSSTVPQWTTVNKYSSQMLF